MKLFTLNAIIDDILLLVRNNNISESEDLSRAQIEQWIHQYRAQLIKQDLNKKHDVNPSYTQTFDLELQKDPINLVDDESSLNKLRGFIYPTIDDIPKPLDLHFGTGIIRVTDLHDCTIQLMSPSRRHYQWLRRTSKEYTYYYKPNKIYVQGVDALRWIRLTAVFEDPTEAGLTPDDSYPIPVDKIGALKQMIFDNELRFMLQRPSDDKDNSSLSGLKPQNNE